MSHLHCKMKPIWHRAEKHHTSSETQRKVQLHCRKWHVYILWADLIKLYSASNPVLYKLEAFLTILKPCKCNNPSKEVDYFEKKGVVFFLFFFSTYYFNVGHQISPEALIRSNISCQIRQLINHRRDQSSLLTDGEMEAGHFLSTSLTFSSAFIRKQNKSELVSVAEAQIFRFLQVFSNGAHMQPAGKLFQRPPPRPPLRRQTSVLMFLFNALHKCMWSNPLTNTSEAVLFIYLFLKV